MSRTPPSCQFARLSTGPWWRTALLGFLLWLAVDESTAAGGLDATDPDVDATVSAGLPPVPGQMLVRFRSGTPLALQERVLGTLQPQLKSVRRFPRPSLQLQARQPAASVFDGLAVVEAVDVTEARRLRAQLAARPEVLYVEPNHRLRLCEKAVAGVPNDFDFIHQWALQNTGQGQGQPGNDIRAPEAWQVIREAPAVRVAIIDTGLDYYHPDLAANVWVNAGEVPGNGIDDDRNGYIDDVHGYDFVSHDSDPMDDYSHGSHVAGIVGALGDNRIGVAGVCWRVPLMAIKAFDDRGEATVAGVIEALGYARANGARIINASWGQTDKSLALQEAVQEVWAAGVLLVAAAGNERTDVPLYPAAYEPVLAVAALNAKGERAIFSNYGAFVDLAAPGDAILSTTPNGRYDLQSGTSMAAPHVTGAAALLLARHPEFTNEQAANVLRNAVDEISTDNYVGTGRLNLAQVVAARSPLPIAQLRLPRNVAGLLDITGTAAGPDFASYLLEFGAGTYPTNWTPFHTNTTPVTQDALFRDFSTAMLAEGVHSLRLTVADALGQQARDRAVIFVRNVVVTAPLNNDVLRAGGRVEIRGTVFGDGRTYSLELGRGLSPETWSTNGLELADGGLRPVFNAVLGWWDTATATPDDFYTLRLTARAGEQVVSEWRVQLLHLDSQLRPGFPIHLEGKGNYPTNDWRHVTIADLDGDGTREILRVQPGVAPGQPARLLVFGADGALRWARELDSGEPSSDIPAVGDVDGDGRPEVFTDVGDQGRLFAFRHDGTPLGGNWPVRLPTGAPGKLLADLDHDGRAELVGLANPWGNGAQLPPLLFVLDGTGALKTSWPVQPCWAWENSPRRLPAVGNFDADRALEIVAPMRCGEVGFFDLDQPGHAVRTNRVDGEILASPVVGDLDGDGREDVIVAATDEVTLEPPSLRGGLYAFDRQGAALPGWPALVGGAFSTPPALADLDGDDRLEVVVVDTRERYLHCLRHDGFSLPGWPVPLFNVIAANTAPVVGDVDGDGLPDVVLNQPGQLQVLLSLGDPRFVGGVFAWNAAGLPIDLHPRGDLKSLFLEATGGPARLKSAQVTLTDLDGNGVLDLVASSIDDVVYPPSARLTSRKERHTLYAWELDASYHAGAMPWPTFQQNPGLTGQLPPPQFTNQPPAIRDLPDQTVRTGTAFFPLALDLYVDDPDHDAALLRWRAEVTGPLQAEISAARVLTVTAPGVDWSGAGTLRLIVEDPEGASATATVTYTARPDYEPPVAVADAATTQEDAEVELDLLANDRHPTRLPLKVERVTRPLHGSAQLLPAGRVRYTPRTDFNGEDAFNYVLSDGQGGVALGTARIQVLPMPDPPAVETDRLSLDEDATAELDALENDADPDGEPLTLEQFTQPANGVVTRVEAGRLRFAPPPDWSGADRFEYVVADPTGRASTGVVEVVVRPVNDPPITQDQTIVINRNSSRDVFYQANDPEGATLTFRILDSPQHGELWTYPTIATYYPKKGFVGEDAFTYAASDGGLTSRVAQVRIQVLDANNPPRVRPLEMATRVNRPLRLPLVADDEDGDDVTFALAQAPAHGEVAPAGTNLVYTPARDFLGEDTFTVRASDGRDTGPEARVSITVTDKNTAPQAEDSTLEVRINTPTPFRLGARDGEGDPLRYVVLTNPAVGAITGAPPELLYTPVTNYTGPDRFTFRVDDGELESDPATVTIQVVPRNRQAIGRDQTLHLPADLPFVVPFELADPDDDPLRIAILKGPRNGLIAGTGTNFIYTPKPGFIGSDIFTYKAWDGITYSETRFVLLYIEGQPPDPPRFESITRLDSGAVRLEVRTAADQTLELQGSADLLNWTTLEAIPRPGERAVFTDTEAPADRPRFYRVLRR